jgi:O-antigen/teichoic acid export membrane protein
MSIKNRIVKSIRYGIFFQLISAGNQILLLPIFLYFWGLEKYGVWLVIVVISSWFSLLDFGMGHYLPNKLSKLKNREKIKEYSYILQMLVPLFLIKSIIFIIIGVIISYPISYGIISSATEILANNTVQESLAVLFSINIFQSLLNFSALIYVSSNDYHKASYRRNQIAILNLFLIPVGLYFHADYLDIAVIMFVNHLMIEALSLVEVFKYYKFGQFKLLKPRVKIIKKYYQESIWFLGVKLYAIGYQSIPVMLLQMFTSATVVVLFSTHGTLVNTTLQFKQLTDGIVWRESSILFALNKIKSISNLYFFIQKITLYFSLLVSLVVLTYGGEIFLYWLNGEVEFDYLLMGLMLVVALVQIPWTSAETVLLSKNEAQFIVISKVMYLFLYAFLGFLSLYLYNSLYYLVAVNILLNIFVLNYLITRKLHIMIEITGKLFLTRIAFPFLIILLYGGGVIFYFYENKAVLLVSYIFISILMFLDVRRTDLSLFKKSISYFKR